MTTKGRESTALVSAATAFKPPLKPPPPLSTENFNDEDWAGNLRGIRDLKEVLIEDEVEMWPGLINVCMAKLVEREIGDLGFFEKNLEKERILNGGNRGSTGEYEGKTMTRKIC